MTSLQLSGVSPVYSLNCSVCQEGFCSKLKWMDHLTQDGHQNLAREKGLQLEDKDLNNNLKDSSLVIFTTYDLTVEDAQKIVEYFSTRNQTTLVTDFVWWKDRPRIGIIQFESRKKLDEILTGLEGNSSGDLLIDNQRVQVKRAIDLMDLLYTAILPGNHNKPQIFDEPIQPSRKRGRGKASHSEDLPPSSKKHCESTSPPHPPPSPSTSQNSSIQSQYWSIRKLVVIPDHLLSQATKAVASLKTLFSYKDPSAEVAIFRTWHLKLTSPSSGNMEDLTVYLYRTKSPPEFPSSYSWIPRERICQLLYDIEKSPESKDFTILDKDPDDYTWRLRYSSGSDGAGAGIPIRLVSHMFVMTEVQICRLFKYMMTFDPRVEHVLSLMYFWTSANEVTIGNSDSNRRNSHLSLFEPLTMQWLLMHFMCYRKYVPTVREIQERPHQVLRERMRGIDIGFDEDPKFAEEWKMSRGLGGDVPSENLVDDVLQLFLEFLQFCWMTLDGDSCIFNTKDGEVIRTESFLSCEPGTQGILAWTTKMTREEVQLVNNTQFKVNLRGWNLYMIHPFIFTCNFSVSWDIGFVVRLMRISEGKLRRFLNKVKCGGVEAAEKRFGNLGTALTVDKMTREKIRSKIGHKK